MWLGVMFLQRHRAIIWYAFRVAWLNFRGRGCSKDYALYYSADFLFFLYWGLPLSFKAKCLHQIDGGLCPAGFHVVARNRAIIWYALG